MAARTSQVGAAARTCRDGASLGTLMGVRAYAASGVFSVGGLRGLGGWLQRTYRVGELPAESMARRIYLGLLHKAKNFGAKKLFDANGIAL